MRIEQQAVALSPMQQGTGFLAWIKLAGALVEINTPVSWNSLET
jgi:hypothetical protein